MVRVMQSGLNKGDAPEAWSDQDRTSGQTEEQGKKGLGQGGEHIPKNPSGRAVKCLCRDGAPAEGITYL